MKQDMKKYNKCFEKTDETTQNQEAVDTEKIKKELFTPIEIHGMISNADAVYIREGAGKDYPDIAICENGKELIILDEEGDWYRVCLPSGAEGYVMKEFVSIGM